MIILSSKYILYTTYFTMLLIFILSLNVKFDWCLILPILSNNRDFLYQKIHINILFWSSVIKISIFTANFRYCNLFHIIESLDDLSNFFWSLNYDDSPFIANWWNKGNSWSWFKRNRSWTIIKIDLTINHIDLNIIKSTWNTLQDGNWKQRI